MIMDLLTRGELRNLTLVSKDLQGWIEPVLYRSVDIPRICFWGAHDHIFLKSLARTFIENPGLRPLVINLNARDGFISGKDPVFDVNVPSHHGKFLGISCSSRLRRTHGEHQ